MTLSWSSCCYNFFVFFFACSCFFFCPLFNGALWVSFYIPLGYLSAYFYTQFLKGNSTMSMVSLHIQVLDWSFRTLFSTIYQLFPTDSSQNVKSYNFPLNDCNLFQNRKCVQPWGQKGICALFHSEM